MPGDCVSTYFARAVVLECLIKEKTFFYYRTQEGEEVWLAEFW